MKEVISKLYWHYWYKAEESKHKDRLLQMLNKMDNMADKWPIDKTNRWLGFVQGVLFSEGLVDIDEEREFTREIFHDYYKRHGIEIPKSVELTV